MTTSSTTIAFGNRRHLPGRAWRARITWPDPRRFQSTSSAARASKIMSGCTFRSIAWIMSCSARSEAWPTTSARRSGGSSRFWSTRESSKTGIRPCMTGRCYEPRNDPPFSAQLDGVTAIFGEAAGPACLKRRAMLRSSIPIRTNC